MALSTTANAAELARPRGFVPGSADDTGSRLSAVSWGAITAGAAAAASLSLILLILGVGLGLSSVSPWTGDGLSATSFGVSTILWLTLTQLLASAMGGYIAGRLRTRWSDVQADEVYFRDTAHGFLAWAVASLVTAGLLTSAIGSILGGGVQAGASVAGGAAAVAGPPIVQGAANGYFVDALFRRDAAGTAGTERASEQEIAEVGRIFTNVARAESLPAEDIRYVGQIVAQHTGLSPAEAGRRVTEVYAKAQAQLRETETAARSAADKARKASAYGALWLFVSLLVGAFVASMAATFGGRRRDA